MYRIYSRADIGILGEILICFILEAQVRLGALDLTVSETFEVSICV